MSPQSAQPVTTVGRQLNFDGAKRLEQWLGGEQNATRLKAVLDWVSAAFIGPDW